MKLQITFILAPSGTKLASCSYKDMYLVEYGFSWEEAEAKLVALVKQQLIEEQKIPPTKEIQI